MNYDFGNVQFKPTKAFEKQFRNDLESALSYFMVHTDFPGILVLL